MTAVLGEGLMRCQLYVRGTRIGEVRVLICEVLHVLACVCVRGCARVDVNACGFYKECELDSAEGTVVALFVLLPDGSSNLIKKKGGS